MMSLPNAIAFVERTTGGAVDKASRALFRKALDFLGNPHAKIPTFHVAGTNGKGAVSMMLTNGILSAGHQVGTYMSPFVYDVRERWLINGNSVSADDFVLASDRVMRVVLEIEQGKPSISTFEIKTLVAFVLFDMLDVDYVVLEVGIGGLLDATNIIPSPVAAIITSIGLDHVDLLGPTIEEIAFQKAGIIKPETGIVVCGDGNLSVQAVVQRCAAEAMVPILFPNPVYGMALTLPGDHQRMNAAVTLAALEHRFGTLSESIIDAVLATTLPGRFECKFINGRTVIFDGAHNQAAAKGLASAIHERCGPRQVVLIVAHSGNHDSSGFGKELLDVTRHVIVTCTPFRPQTPEAAAAFYASMNKSVTIVRDPDAAIHEALDLYDEDVAIVICGSFYLASSFKKLDQYI
jgi:dihydrofolate synthase/folylpolyglutamate synthase